MAAIATRANIVLDMAVITDQSAMRESYRAAAEELGFRVIVEEPSTDNGFHHRRSDVVLLDVRPPESRVLDLLERVKEASAETEVIVISSGGSVAAAVHAMRLGAFDYVTKPFNLDEFRGLLQRAAEHVRASSETRLLRESMRTRHGFGSLVGSSPDMERLYRIIAKAARSTHPVLILGESGTGKQLVARSIHYAGPNRDKPFIPVDCGSLVPTLIEAELFGYVKGAFTGATRSKEGLLAIANGGTVFLDEIGELPLDLQAKLLRALQEKEIRPVGSTQATKIHVRILAATNRDLELAVQQGTFRKDLFYRLNVLTLRIPPLRERRDDIPLLVQHFLERLSRNSGGATTIGDEAMELLLEYDWPGNVRELENCLERACAMSSGPALHVGDLPSALQNSRAARLSESLVAAVASSGHEGARILPIAELEKRAIIDALEQLRGDKLMAARLLGIGKTTLYRKLKEYGFHN
jgi:DNA-binding NtrC family response regulator